MRSAYEANRTFAGGIRDCLGAFLQFLAEEPRYADMLIVEVLAAGRQRSNAATKSCTSSRSWSGVAPSRCRRAPGPPDLTAETIIGGIYEVVYSRVLSGPPRGLAAPLPDLAYSLMQPYLGDEVARREAAQPPDSGDAGRRLGRTAPAAYSSAGKSWRARLRRAPAVVSSRTGR